MGIGRVVFAVTDTTALRAAEFTECMFSLYESMHSVDFDALPLTTQGLPSQRLLSAQWPTEHVSENTLWKLYRVRQDSKNAKDDQLSSDPGPDEYLTSWVARGMGARWQLSPGRYKLRIQAIDREGTMLGQVEHEFFLRFPKSSEGTESMALSFREHVERVLDGISHAANSRHFLQKLRTYLSDQEQVVVDSLRDRAQATLGSAQISDAVLLDAIAAGIKRLSIDKRESVTKLKTHVLQSVQDLTQFLQTAARIDAGVDVLRSEKSSFDSDTGSLSQLRLSATDIRKLAKSIIDLAPEESNNAVREYAIQKQVFKLVDNWFPEWTEVSELWGSDIFEYCQRSLDSRLHITLMLNNLGFYDARENPAVFKGLETDMIEAVLEEWFRDGTDLRSYDSEGAFFLYLEAKVRNKKVDFQRRGIVQQFGAGSVEQNLSAEEKTTEKSAFEEELDVLRFETPSSPDPSGFQQGILRAAQIQAANAERQGRRRINPERLAEKLMRQMTPCLTISVFDHVSQESERIQVPIDATWEIGRQTSEERQRFGKWKRPIVDSQRKRVLLASFYHNTFSKQILRIIPTYMLQEFSVLGRTVALHNPSKNYDLCLLGSNAGEIVIHPEDSYVTSNHLNFYYRVSHNEMHYLEETEIGQPEIIETHKLDFSIRLDIAFEDLSVGQLTDVLVAKHQWIDSKGTSSLLGNSISCTRPPKKAAAR